MRCRITAVTIRRLQERLVTNPQDAEALRDLGVIYFETKQYPQARDYLKKASLANDRDGKTLFYLGMTQEYDRDLRAALATYLNYTDIAESSPYRKLMEGRYQVGDARTDRPRSSASSPRTRSRWANRRRRRTPSRSFPWCTKEATRNSRRWDSGSPK